MRRYCCLLAVVLLCCLGCRSRTQSPAGATTRNAESGARAAASLPQAPGQFDYYLFTLSWSPEYCHGHPNNPQCDGSHPGFVVHGLWPQYADGRWPSHCSTARGLANPASMLDIMPDPRLIAHEWATHGTCTGLSASAYFGTIRAAYRRILVPAELQHLSRTRRSSADAVKQFFVEANPGLTPDAVAIQCHNRYLAGVEFCMSKSLQPIACEAVRSCTARTLMIPAER